MLLSLERASSIEVAFALLQLLELRPKLALLCRPPCPCNGLLKLLELLIVQEFIGVLLGAGSQDA